MSSSTHDGMYTQPCNSTVNIHEDIKTFQNNTWTSFTACKSARKALPKLNGCLSRKYLKLNREVLTAALKDHSTFNKHLFNWLITDSPLSRPYVVDKETENLATVLQRDKLLGKILWSARVARLSFQQSSQEIYWESWMI